FRPGHDFSQELHLQPKNDPESNGLCRDAITEDRSVRLIPLAIPRIWEAAADTAFHPVSQPRIVSRRTARGFDTAPACSLQHVHSGIQRLLAGPRFPADGSDV